MAMKYIVIYENYNRNLRLLYNGTRAKLQRVERTNTKKGWCYKNMGSIAINEIVDHNHASDIVLALLNVAGVQ